MRALHITPYFAPAFRYGGPPRSILGLCKGLQHAGVDVEVLTTAANGPDELAASPEEGNEYEGVAVRYLPRAFPRRYFGARIRRPLSLALGRVDLCHVHGIWNMPEWTATRLARAHGVPYLLSPRGMLQPGALRRGTWQKRIAYRVIEQSGLAGARLLHATSDSEADVLRGLGLDVPVVTVPNGVDLTAAAGARPGFRARLGIPPGAFVIVFLGRMHPIKRLDLLAEAFGELRRTHAEAHLVLAGPDERGHLAEVTARLGSHAGFVHAVDGLDDRDKWALLRDANVSVQCSDSESFGMAVVEAMAAAVPVVVTRTCPWPEIETRECGFWVEQSAQAIADALRALIEDRGRREAMGARGAAYAREGFSWDAIGRVMALHYDDVLSRERGDHVA